MATLAAARGQEGHVALSRRRPRGPGRGAKAEVLIEPGFSHPDLDEDLRNGLGIVADQSPSPEAVFALHNPFSSLRHASDFCRPPPDRPCAI